MAAMLMACLLPVSAGVLTFDDISGIGVAVPAGYGGFTWDSNIFVYDWSTFNNNYGNTYPFSSMNNAVYNGYGILHVSMSGSPFTFDGASFTGWDENNGIASYTATSVTVSGYSTGNLVGTASTNLPAGGFVWLAANMGPVDELVFTSSADGNWWLMDNFTFNSGVPEPGSLLLFVAGLTLVAARKLRRR